MLKKKKTISGHYLTPKNLRSSTSVRPFLSIMISSLVLYVLYFLGVSSVEAKIDKLLAGIENIQQQTSSRHEQSHLQENQHFTELMTAPSQQNSSTFPSSGWQEGMHYNPLHAMDYYSYSNSHLSSASQVPFETPIPPTAPTLPVIPPHDQLVTPTIPVQKELPSLPENNSLPPSLPENNSLPPSLPENKSLPPPLPEDNSSLPSLEENNSSSPPKSKFPIDQTKAKLIYSRVGKKMTTFTGHLMEYVWGQPYLLTHKLTTQRQDRSKRTVADAFEVDQIVG